MRSFFTTRNVLVLLFLLVTISAIVIFRARATDAELVEVGAVTLRDVFRSYVTALGLPPDPLAEEFARVHPEDGPPDLLPAPWPAIPMT